MTAPPVPRAAISFCDVDIVFGPRPQDALAMIDQNMSREQILDATGQVLGCAGVSLDVQRGEICVLMGLSGSGKSTLIRMSLREERATKGTIWVAGKDITKMPTWKVPYLRRTVGTVFQDFKLLPNKTVGENVAFALEVIGRPRSVVRRQVQQVLELVGLSTKSDRYPSHLSGGEQQRVSVGASLPGPASSNRRPRALGMRWASRSICVGRIRMSFPGRTRSVGNPMRERRDSVECVHTA